LRLETFKISLKDGQRGKEKIRGGRKTEKRFWGPAKEQLSQRIRKDRRGSLRKESGGGSKLRHIRRHSK